MAKKDKKDKGNKRNIPNKEMMLRMNYLYQASHFLSNIKKAQIDNNQNEINEDGDLAGVGRIYCNQLKKIGRKLVIRLDPSIKRKICKRCDSFLIPGKTCSLEVEDPNPEKKNVPALIYECHFCKGKKRYLQDPDHRLFTEVEENIL